MSNRLIVDYSSITQLKADSKEKNKLEIYLSIYIYCNQVENKGKKVW